MTETIKVAVTSLEYSKAFNVFSNTNGFECLSAPIEEKALAHFIGDNKIAHVIVGVEKYKHELYEALPSGGIIARFGIGHDGIDKVKARTKGIYCTNTPGVLDSSVAECAVGLMLTAARRLGVCSSENRSGVWKNRIGIELTGKTLAIIGCGKIGCKVARIARLGFGMRVIGFDMRNPLDTSAVDEFSTEFEESVENADFVSLHIPDISSTKDFINAERLALMKPSAVLINTARGGILDEDALYDTLKVGDIAGAALDVFKKEPYEPWSVARDLRMLENVIMTPHIGSSTVEACKRMAHAALENIRLLKNGKIEEMNLIRE